MFDFGYSLPIIVALFLITAFALNRLLFKPMQAILDERERRTSGTFDLSKKSLEEYSRLFDAYKAQMKKAQMEGYSLQDQARTESQQNRSKHLAAARAQAETIVQGMKDELRQQIAQSQERLKADVEELSTRIAALLLQKSA